MSITFAVSDMSKAHNPDWDVPEIPLPKAYQGEGNFEAWGGPEKVLMPYGPLNGLLSAAHTAFMQHKRLQLSPDHIWIQIARVAAEHITNNAELLRKNFVSFEGQKVLSVQRNDFVKGSADNAWPEVFQEFSRQITGYVGLPTHDRFVCNFSTTGSVEKAASEVVLMDAMSKYFKYQIRTTSGIPEVTLLGTPEDWAQVLYRATGLKEYGMEKWLDQLLPMLGEFVQASVGKPNQEWWQDLYMMHSGSGGVRISGNIRILFPKKLEVLRVISFDDVPASLSRVPFLWKYYDKEFKMRFCAGVPLAILTEDGAIAPTASWAIEELK